MLQVLDKNLNIRVFSNDNNPHTYYLSHQGFSKCVIDVKEVDNNNILIIPVPQGECSVEELNAIINCFCNFMFNQYSEINGILMSADPTPLLEQIGFKLLSEDSEYLYNENKRINKVR